MTEAVKKVDWLNRTAWAVVWIILSVVAGIGLGRMRRDSAACDQVLKARDEYVKTLLVKFEAGYNPENRITPDAAGRLAGFRELGEALDCRMEWRE